MLMARDAVKAGMADRVATFDDTVQRLARGGTAGGKSAFATGGIVPAGGAALVGDHGVEQITPAAKQTIDVEIVGDATAIEKALVTAYVTARMGAITVAGLSITDALAMSVPEIEAAIEAAREDPEGGQPSSPELVDGAERLLEHAAVREAFTPGPTT
jgi:hypothetical protein